MKRPPETVRWLFGICLLLAAPLAAQTFERGITLLSDDEVVHMGDVITIEVLASGLLDPPDIGPLFRDADLLRETRGTRIAVIEGQVVEVDIRRMEFLPKREGKLRFGPLQGELQSGSTSSNTLTVEVLAAADPNWQPDENDVEIDVRFSDEEVFVGEKLQLDIVLRHRYRVASETIALPSLAGATVFPVFESRRTWIDSDNDGVDDFRQIAWRYLLFPERSGSLPTATLSWSGELIRSRTQRARFERELTLPAVRVKGAVEHHAWWLPASDVRLEESWSSDPRELRAGESLTRTITLTARGVAANQLPDIPAADVRGIQHELIDSRRHDRLLADDIVGEAVFVYRINAFSAISIFLDTIRVRWWNTDTGREAESLIPARRIDIGLPTDTDAVYRQALEDPELGLAQRWLPSLPREPLVHTALALLLSLAVSLAWIVYRAIRRRRTLERLLPDSTGSTRET